MPAERAGYTVTMFLVDTSPSMGEVRTVELPPGPNGEERTTEITNLEWALRYVKTKVQEMIFNGRKTDQCGVIVFGSDTTDNIINDESEGYESVVEYIPIATPNAGTLAKLDELLPSETTGDPIDALIVGIETQARHLGKKKTWTRKVVLVTDGNSEIETEDWEATVDKMNEYDVKLTVVGVDFDDAEFGYTYENKTSTKRNNEKFFHDIVGRIKDGNGILGTCEHALEEVGRPDTKQVKSALMGTILRLGDPDRDADMAIEIMVKASKATALQRPATMKKFALLQNEDKDEDEDAMEVDEDVEQKAVFAQLKMRTQYYYEPDAPSEEDAIKLEDEEEGLLLDGDDEKKEKKVLQKVEVEKEELIRGFKYGTTYAPCPDGQFPKLPTSKGITICGFFPAENFRRELSMGEIQYIWGDPGSPQQQVAISSLSRAMEADKKMAIARWVSRDGMDPKMGVLVPSNFDKVDCLLWAPMPFADDVRKYTFASLDRLVSKKGELITEHPYIPTEEQREAMDAFVDCMDLMGAADDEEGNRTQWFNPSEAFNPAIHRIKQAIFHCAVVSDISTNPLPPPHPELTKYFEPPPRTLKRVKKTLPACQEAFSVKQVPKRVGKVKKDDHEHAAEEAESELLLNQKGKAPVHRQSTLLPTPSAVIGSTKLVIKGNDSGSETEPESDEEGGLLLDTKKPASTLEGKAPPTPARSVSPKPKRSSKRDEEDGDEDIDPGRAPGRIIGSTHPLKDFKKNISQGDVVTKAVEDISAVVTEILLKPFASRRSDEMLECMKAMRKVCLEEDEVDAWNAFLQNLKTKCLSSKPKGNPGFWEKVREEGRSLSLLTEKEVKKYGGTSQYSEKQAVEFVT